MSTWFIPVAWIDGAQTIARSGRHICVSGVSEIVFRIILGNVRPIHEKQQSVLISI